MGICKNFEITITTIYSNIERSEQLLKQNVFLTCSWRFLRSLCNTLEQFKFKLEKIIGIKKPAGKVRNICLLGLNSRCGNYKMFDKF